eukprot:gene20475-biopygen20768
MRSADTAGLPAGTGDRGRLAGLRAPWVGWLPDWSWTCLAARRHAFSMKETPSCAGWRSASVSGTQWDKTEGSDSTRDASKNTRLARASAMSLRHIGSWHSTAALHTTPTQSLPRVSATLSLSRLAVNPIPWSALRPRTVVTSTIRFSLP